ncbi:MAG: hypothetical protein HGA75_07285 [Thiobacillus sp.]|nr:hypothetical protein [Thiobacillus sp.]
MHGAAHATIAMFGAALSLLMRAAGHDAEHQAEQVPKRCAEVEWVAIFFVGLFVVVAGVEKAGALVSFTGGALALTAYVILWTSAIVSAVVDNLPFVATMIPVIQNLGSVVGPENLGTLWWSLAQGACLVGASANLVVAGFAERAGTPHPVSPLHAGRLPVDAGQHRRVQPVRRLALSVKGGRGE